MYFNLNKCFLSLLVSILQQFQSLYIYPLFLYQTVHQVKKRFFFKEFIAVAIIIILLNFISIYLEDLVLIKWSRMLSSVLIFFYLLFKHKLYKIIPFFVGVLLLVITDIFYVYIDYVVPHLLYMIFSVITFFLFTIRVNCFIRWKKVNKVTIIAVTLFSAGMLYFLDHLVSLVVVNIEDWLLIAYLVYAIVGFIYCSIAVISYLQLDRIGNGNYLYIAYGFLLSSAFLLVAFYSERLEFYYFERGLYLLVLFSLSHIIMKRLAELGSK